jgi:hypothetical protein
MLDDAIAGHFLWTLRLSSSVRYAGRTKLPRHPAAESNTEVQGLDFDPRPMPRLATGKPPGVAFVPRRRRTQRLFFWSLAFSGTMVFGER